MFHYFLIILISLAVTGQPSKAPAYSQNYKQTPDWLDTNNETTSTPVRDYTLAIDAPSVNLPTEETVWGHGDSRVRVTWDGLDGTLVKVQLLQNGSPIADVINWSDNNNSALIEGTVQSSWGSGSGFQIKVEDNLGNSLTSETFRIMAPINVSQPRITTVWSHAERDVTIAWSGSPGNTVDIVLFDGEYQVATLASRAPNTGSFTYPSEVSSGWGTGDNYSVRITDDIGNEYTSRHFSINAINVTSPTTDAIWSDQNPTLNVTWDGGSRVVRFALYRGSTKIKDLTEWIDNTGYCEIGDFLAHNLDAGSNYKIEVRDDQGDQGFSQALSVSYSQSTQQGASRITPGEVRGILPGYSLSQWFDIGTLSAGAYRVRNRTSTGLGVYSGENLVYSDTGHTDSIVHLRNRSPYSVNLFRRNLLASGDYNVSIQPVEQVFVPKVQIEPSLLLSTNFVGGSIGYGARVNVRIMSEYDFGIDVCKVISSSDYVDDDESVSYEVEPYLSTTLMFGKVMGNMYWGDNSVWTLGVNLMHNNINSEDDVPDVLINEIEKESGFHPGVFVRAYSWNSPDVPVGMSFMFEYFPLLNTIQIENALVTIGGVLIIGSEEYR